MLGRKRAMFLVNIPLLIAWALLTHGASVAEIFIGTALMGICNGVAQPVVAMYIGEIA